MPIDNLSADEVRRVAVHEAGHECEGRYCGRHRRRIEWIVDEHGSRAQCLMGDLVLPHDVSHLLVSHPDLPDAVREELEFGRTNRQMVLRGRIRVGVAGVVAVAAMEERHATLDDLRGDDTCGVDLHQAVETAKLLLNTAASEDQIDELIVEIMDEVADELTPERIEEVRRVADRLTTKRTAQPHGLVVLDSREADEILGLVEALWSQAPPQT